LVGRAFGGWRMKDEGGRGDMGRMCVFVIERKGKAEVQGEMMRVLIWFSGKRLGQMGTGR
jgi:hypothetical protein